MMADLRRQIALLAKYAQSAQPSPKPSLWRRLLVYILRRKS